MSEILLGFFPSVGLLFGLFLAGLIVFYLVVGSIKNRGRVARGLNMELFLILIPQDEYLEPGQKPKTDKERTQPMEQLYSVFASMMEKGSWRIFEFGQPYLVWEIAYIKNEIRFYVSVPARYKDMLVRAVHSVSSEAVVEPAPDYNIFIPEQGGGVAASYLRTRRSSFLPIKTYQDLEVDPLNEIATHFSKLIDNEGAVMQILMRPSPKKFNKTAFKITKKMQEGYSFDKAFHLVKKSWLAPFKVKAEKANPVLTPQDQEIIKGIENHAAKPNFEVNIRLVASAPTEERAELILKDFETSFNQFNFPNLNDFSESREKKKNIIFEFSFRLFDENKKIILSSEELASIYHLPHQGIRVPKIKWLKARSAPAPWGMNDGPYLGWNEFRSEQTIVRIAPDDRRRHSYIIGQTGTGKSTLLQEMIRQDVEMGNGIAVLDPHGDLVEYTLSHIPQHRWKDVILFDPSDIERPIGINMLEAASTEERDFVVQEMMSIFYKLFPPETMGPMFEHNMRNAMLTLMADEADPGTLVEIPRIFTDKEFQKNKVAKVTDPIVKSFWEKEMAQTSDFHKSEMLGYLVSKVGRFIENGMMRNIIGQTKSGINFAQIMNEKKILLANLSKGKVGDVNANLLGLMIVGKLQLNAMRRAYISESERVDFYLYLDEFQNFTTDSIATILSEARKYRLSMVMAHQYIAQLTDKIKAAVFGNVGTMIMFRIGVEDAEFLKPQLAPLFNERDLINLDNHNAYVKLMFKGQTSRPFNLKTYPPVQGNAETIKVVKNLSRMTYGKEREVVEQEILARARLGPSLEQAQPQLQPNEPKFNL
ncbi:MAG: type IV secretion system DNA-binding domain-containing protein [bacterium]|nr:type IV secretion system DNA-binding domain-containing protein [bacterium]